MKTLAQLEAELKAIDEKGPEALSLDPKLRARRDRLLEAYRTHRHRRFITEAEDIVIVSSKNPPNRRD